MKTYRFVIVVLIYCFASGFAHEALSQPVTLFFHDGDAIRLNHQTRNEEILIHSIDTEVEGVAKPTEEIVFTAGFPFVLYVNNRFRSCPGQADGCINPSEDRMFDARCEIFVFRRGDPIQITPNGRVPGLASDSQPNAGYCYYGLAANPSNSVVAASVEGEITGAETQIDGFLVMRINGNWVEIDTDPANTGSQGISGVSDKAINDEGSRIAFVKDGHIFLAPIDNLSAIKQSTPGDHPAFGTKGTGEALAWIQDRKLNIAKLHHCNPPDPGICRNNPEIQAELPGSDEFIVTSLDWNADSRNIVYILSDGSTSEIRQFNVDSRQHSNPIISDRREKTSISIMAN